MRRATLLEVRSQLATPRVRRIGSVEVGDDLSGVKDAAFAATEVFGGGTYVVLDEEGWPLFRLTASWEDEECPALKEALCAVCAEWVANGDAPGTVPCVTGEAHP